MRLREWRVSAPWCHVKRSPALPETFRITLRCTHPQTRPLDQLYKNHPRPSALASTLLLSFGAGTALEGSGCSRRDSLSPHGRSAEVRRAVGLDRRSFVRRQLGRPLSAGATRPAANTMICHLVSSLSRGCPPTGTIHPPRTCNVHRAHSPEGHITHSTLVAPRTPCPVQQARKVSAAFATTHMPQVPSRSRFAVRARPRADELIGLKVDVPGEFITDFELVFVQETQNKFTSRHFSQSPTRHRLSRTSTGTLSAAQSQTSHRGHLMHRSRPPAPRSLLRRPPVIFFCQWWFHFTTSLRKARGANSNRRKRTRRPSCSQ